MRPSLLHYRYLPLISLKTRKINQLRHIAGYKPFLDLLQYHSEQLLLKEQLYA